DDPACDLAVAAALASAATGVPAPEGTAFVGEVTLTGLVRPAPAMAQRLSAARAAGVRTVVAGAGSPGSEGVRIRAARTLAEAMDWALDQRIRGRGVRSA
ncbi:MAG: S16 family serine protease, partial [Actinomycetota bacterium]